MQDISSLEMNWFTQNLEEKTPFAFARFNDGEMMAVDNVGCTVARGDQVGNEPLSNALHEALI